MLERENIAANQAYILQKKGMEGVENMTIDQAYDRFCEGMLYQDGPMPNRQHFTWVLEDAVKHSPPNEDWSIEMAVERMLQNYRDIPISFDPKDPWSMVDALGHLGKWAVWCQMLRVAQDADHGKQVKKDTASKPPAKAKAAAKKKTPVKKKVVVKPAPPKPSLF